MQRLTTTKTLVNPIYKKLTSTISKPHFNSPTIWQSLSTKPSKHGDEEWNSAWESAWLPEDLTPKTRAPWESDVNFSSTATLVPSDADPETKAFVEDMNDNWNERRKSLKNKQQEQEVVENKDNNINNISSNGSLYSVENMKKDYRLKKQRIHAGLWMKEIEKLQEAKLEDSLPGGGGARGGARGGDDIERLLDSCSEIFDSANNDLDDSKIPSSSEFKNKPDGWETTTKAQDGNIWEMSQREEDILLQEFDRRIAYSKFQIASFVKTHIFSRRRPIDGWKYMIEEIGPNARRGKGSVPRVPSLSDASTQPFKEEKTPIGRGLTPIRGR